MSVTLHLKPSITVLSVPTFVNPPHLPGNFYGTASPVEQLSEYAGRVCYMSQHNPGQKTTAEYLRHILELGHGSVLEHGMFSFLLEGVSRSLTHELIRHRVGTAVSQLSQRFVDESHTAFVCPPEIAAHPELLGRFENACAAMLNEYRTLYASLQERSPYDPATMPLTMWRKRMREAARAVLPNCVETKLVWSCNLRELRHILLLRGSTHADLEFQEFAKTLLAVTRPLAYSALEDLVIDPFEGIISKLPSSSP